MTHTNDHHSDEASKKTYTVVAKHEKFIPFGRGWFKVPRWNSTHEATGWTLRGADLSLPGGRPYGPLWYVHNKDGREVRIGVRWDVDREVTECRYLHPTKSEYGKDRDAVNADALELDAQARVTALDSINAFLFAQIAPRATEDAILEAAGLGLPHLDDDPRATEDG